MSHILETKPVQQLARIIEESTRSTQSGVKYFIEPAVGTLNRATTKRHHIIFGRRGSGKSSLLYKLRSDFSLDRRATAYVDLEEFKGHSYPDVLISVLIKTLTEFKTWFDSTAIKSSSSKSWWQKLFGAAPTRTKLDTDQSGKISSEIADLIKELNEILHSGDEQKTSTTVKKSESTGYEGKGSIGFNTQVASASAAASGSSKDEQTKEVQQEYTSKKIESLHRNIIKYKALFGSISSVSGGASYLLLDDFYHLRIADQASVLDYFHRIAKGSNLWIKVGTIRHRSRWYIFGTPPVGMKLGDDAEQIDLDVTLEKYDTTKRFLVKILEGFSKEAALNLSDIITDGARDRLVLASGGVARDFLTIFRRALDIASERVLRADNSRGEKIGAEDVNKASGENDTFKREDFTRDTGVEEQKTLLSLFENISDFCLTTITANCFLVDKDLSNKETRGIAELVDLKFLHHIKSRVTVREKSKRLYDAYMLDLSQYAGERARRNFDILEFWGAEAEDELRRTKLIFLERT